ncbi:hypothetical protein [Comamonas sp.]|uniref:LexA family protein n=1 Tax=Comamonas sp. TaxID=34028 RepID=UPI00289FAA72|nr:hypothetical protein [Comamonas sp.]
MKTIPARQLEVLTFMRGFFKDNDQTPPMAVIAQHFGFRSPNAAQYHVEWLLRHGYLERNSVGNLRFARGNVVVDAIAGGRP